MNTSLDKLRTAMADYLNEHGVEAVTAWPDRERRRVTGPVAAVSLRSCEGGPGGFRDYLGERYDSEAGDWKEIYGKKVELVFGLDIYAPGKGGAEQCQSAMDRLAEALHLEGPRGLKVLSYSMGEGSYDQEQGLFHCPAEARCGAWLYAVADESGIFLDFEVKGERK